MDEWTVFRLTEDGIAKLASKIPAHDPDPLRTAGLK
jgi:hypothetical protein